MKGYALLTLDNILDIKSRIKHVFAQGYTPKYRTEKSLSLFKFRWRI